MNEHGGKGGVQLPQLWLSVLACDLQYQSPHAGHSLPLPLSRNELDFSLRTLEHPTMEHVGDICLVTARDSSDELDSLGVIPPDRLCPPDVTDTVSVRGVGPRTDGPGSSESDPEEDTASTVFSPSLSGTLVLGLLPSSRSNDVTRVGFSEEVRLDESWRRRFTRTLAYTTTMAVRKVPMDVIFSHTQATTPDWPGTAMGGPSPGGPEARSGGGKHPCPSISLHTASLTASRSSSPKPMISVSPLFSKVTANFQRFSPDQSVARNFSA
mmetsp:Transcript_2989/g.7732  ORF Transcript_2989/g.7732 Transcript_2989/m.7732 type:complete len:268 (-) Transcript_2989:304-1107(-)